jgi:type III pantothenate kinase
MIYGYAGLIDGLVERMRGELGGRATVVATGGLAALVEPVARSIDLVNPNLTLEGLRVLHARQATG